MSSEPEAPAAGRPHRKAVRALLVAFSMLAVVAIFASWADRQLLDTGEWVDTSGELLENPEIEDSVANFAVDELYANVDVAKLLQDRLPRDFQGLSGPAASGLRELALEGAREALGSARIQQAWRDANRAAHKRLVAIVKGDSNVVRTRGSEVVLDLRPLVEDVANELGIGGLVNDRLPEDVGELKILESSELELAQDVAKGLDALAIFSALALVVLLGVALYLSRGYRWVTLVAAGAGLLLAGIFVLLLRELAGNVVTHNLAAEGARPAADAAWGIGTSLLAAISVTAITYGLVVVGAGWLASGHRSAVLTRRGLAPALRDWPAISFSVLAVAGLIYVASGIGSNTVVMTRLSVVALALLGLWFLRRHALAEAPDASYEEMGGWVRERWQGMRARRRGEAVANGHSAPDPQDQKLERLSRLGDLRDRGVLTEDEFETVKRQLLEGGEPLV